MNTHQLAVARARAQGHLVLVLFVMSALITVALAGTVTYLRVASADAVHTVLASALSAERTARVQTRLDADGAGQDAAAGSVIAGLLPADALVWRTVRTPPVTLVGGESRLVLAADDAIAEVATLTSGAWPAGPSEMALQADAADALSLSVGASVSVAVEGVATTFTLAGTWRPNDLQAPHWAGDPSVRLGADPFERATFGPAIITPEALLALDAQPFVHWSITPPDTVEPRDLPAWEAGLARLEGDLSDAGVDVRGLTLTGGLPTTLADASTGLASVRAATAIPLVIVGLVSFVALWQIARLLVALRERETRVLLSRGASHRQLIRLGAAESGVVALPGAALGAGVVLLAAAKRPGLEPSTVLLIAGAVAAVSWGVLTAVAGQGAARGLDPTSESGRARTVLGFSALLLVILAAAFTLWRFRRNGSPLVPGTTTPDLVAVVAPALGLLAIALLTVAAAGPLTRLLARWAATRSGYSPVAELRQTSRRLSLNAVPVILVVLATAITTVAAGYAGTWANLRAMSAAVSNGADVRVTFPASVTGPNPRELAAYLALDAVSAGTGVVQASLRADEHQGQLTALPSSALGVSSAPESVLAPSLADLLAPPAGALAGIEVPDGATGLSLDVTASAETEAIGIVPTRDVAISVWLFDGLELLRVPAGVLSPIAEDRWNIDPETGEGTIVERAGSGDPVTDTFEVDLPRGTWRIVALDADVLTEFAPTSFAVSIDALRADGSDLLAGTELTWSPDTLPAPTPSDIIAPGEGILSLTTTLTVAPEALNPVQATLRFMPERPGAVEVPVAITPAWAEGILDSGSTVTINGVEFDVRAVAQVPVVPGNAEPAAAIADLTTLRDAFLRTTANAPAVTEVWLATGEAARVAEEAAEVAGPRNPVLVGGDGSVDPISAPALVVFWAAALLALVLALPAVAAVSLTQAAARRGEVVVLRAVGVGADQQARSRRAELLGLVLGAVVAGLGAGIAACALVMVDLVRSTTPQVSRAVPVDVSFELPLGGLFLAVIVVAVVALAFWYGRRVRAQTLDTAWREEIR